MPRQLEQLDLRSDKIVDENIRESFQGLEEYLQARVLNQGEWKFFELNFSAPISNLLFAHQFKFVPTDILITQIQGDQNVVFNYGLFDNTNLNITANGPAKIRFFAGRYEDSRGNLVVEPHPFVSPGGGGVTDHTLLTSIGVNTHPQIDSHLASGLNPHSVTLNQITPTNTKGDLLVENATVITRKPIGNEGQHFVVRAAQATGVDWEDPVDAVSERFNFMLSG